MSFSGEGLVCVVGHGRGLKNAFSRWKFPPEDSFSFIFNVRAALIQLRDEQISSPGNPGFQALRRSQSKQTEKIKIPDRSIVRLRPLPSDRMDPKGNSDFHCFVSTFFRF